MSLPVVTSRSPGRRLPALHVARVAPLVSGSLRPDPASGFHLQVYQSSRALRVGYYETDNYTRPTPAMRRALLETKKSLEAAGHTV